ncbi:hypothetical protein DAMA08_053390 [Martiniozyma asiatica (nom. inval.)]|nr:hypothetical protein DAMA08_053390 [Martiniozyma asiatica]
MDSIQGEMIQQLTIHQSQLENTFAAIETFKRKNQMLSLTAKEIEQSGQGSVWQAVGRSFVEIPVSKHLNEIKESISENINNVNNLNKKKHYLETSIKNTTESLQKIQGLKE